MQLPNKLIALIEGDECTYTPAFASEHTIYRVYPKGDEADGWIASFRYKKQLTDWINNFKVDPELDITVVTEKEYQSLHIALYNARQYVEGILRATHAQDYILYFTGENNIRKNIAKTKVYKGNRDPDNRPKYYHEIKQFLQKHYKNYTEDTLEADDMCSITQWKSKDNTTIVCSKDKDLLQVPGWNYNPQKKKSRYITRHEACVQLYYQLLVGDDTDNIPSVKEFTTINRLQSKKWYDTLNKLETEEEMYNYIYNIYNNNILDNTIEAIEEVGNLVLMRQDKGQMYKAGEMYYGI